MRPGERRIPRVSLALGRDVLRAGHQPKAAKPLGLSIQPVLDDRTIRGELANSEEKKKLAEQIAIMRKHLGPRRQGGGVAQESLAFPPWDPVLTAN